MRRATIELCGECTKISPSHLESDGGLEKAKAVRVHSPPGLCLLNKKVVTVFDNRGWH
jgi:hypothetical protein